MSRATLTSSAYAVLGLLARRPSAGYELGTRAVASIDNFWPLTRTHIYGELAKLEALGYVVGVEVAQENLPDKRVYSVTPQGERALDAWLADPDPGAPRPRQPMLVKLFFGERIAPERAAAPRTPTLRAGSGARRRSLACGGSKPTSLGSTRCQPSSVCQPWRDMLRLTSPTEPPAPCPARMMLRSSGVPSKTHPGSPKWRKPPWRPAGKPERALDDLVFRPFSEGKPHEQPDSTRHHNDTY